MGNRCEFWKEYDSVAGVVSYCELAAFNRPVNRIFWPRLAAQQKSARNAWAPWS